MRNTRIHRRGSTEYILSNIPQPVRVLSREEIEALNIKPPQSK